MTRISEIGGRIRWSGGEDWSLGERKGVLPAMSTRAILWVGRASDGALAMEAADCPMIYSIPGPADGYGI